MKLKRGRNQYGTRTVDVVGSKVSAVTAKISCQVLSGVTPGSMSGQFAK